MNFREVCLFREKAFGGIGSAKRILSFFTVPKDALREIESDGYAYENGNVAVCTQRKNEVYEIKLSFKRVFDPNVEMLSE